MIARLKTPIMGGFEVFFFLFFFKEWMEHHLNTNEVF